MATLRAPAPLTRPQSVTLAVALSVFVIIANFATPVLPSGSGDDKVPTFVVAVGAAGQNLKRLLSAKGWGQRPWPDS